MCPCPVTTSNFPLSYSHTPFEHYSQDLAQGTIQPERAQEETIKALESVYGQIVDCWRESEGLFGSLLGQKKKAIRQIKGLYLWGGVGRGKTYLMDIFYQCLPGERKMRMHFHRFMQMVHRSLYSHRGKKNPLELVAGQICEKADVLCFDEFYVSEIGDAMILGNLLEALLEEGIVLVTTSNIPPPKLYERGLQRQNFLSAIALLEAHTTVINLDGGTDYRLRTLENAGIYHSPLGDEADKGMLDCFDNLSKGMSTWDTRSLEILGRDITVQRSAEGIAWFEFEDLCAGPRSAADYIEISQLFHTVLLSNVPVFDESLDDKARRFISMVDEFYDQNVKLILSAALPLEALYQGDELALTFERTCSRLMEMQSLKYLGQEHRPEASFAMIPV